MHKMTQAEFDALKRNENGYLVIPDLTDCTGINFGAADKMILVATVSLTAIAN